MTTTQVNGKIENLIPLSSKTPEPTISKICMGGYDGNSYPCAKCPHYTIISFRENAHHVTRLVLANVNSRSRALCHRPSVCRLSVCLSVCNVSCTLIRRLKFSAMFLRHLVRLPSIEIQVKFYGDRPMKTSASEK